METRGKWELDTAFMYCSGVTEQLIGSVFTEDPTLRAKLVQNLIVVVIVHTSMASRGMSGESYDAFS